MSEFGGKIRSRKNAHLETEIKVEITPLNSLQEFTFGPLRSGIDTTESRPDAGQPIRSEVSEFNEKLSGSGYAVPWSAWLGSSTGFPIQNFPGRDQLLTPQFLENPKILGLVVARLVSGL